MPLLTHIVQAQITDQADTIEGKILSRPALLYGDATQLTYAADVDIGQTGRDPVSGDEVVLPLKNVPIAPGNRELIYADVGAAVTLSRSHSGRYEIIGFAKRAPGTYTRVCINLSTGALGPTEDLGLSARPLTYEELYTVGAGYGITPYGAVGVFRGSTLLEIK